jgi:nitroreductase
MEPPTTSPTIDLIHQHSSVRSYTTETVAVETIEVIIEAAQRAATSSNLQMWTAVAVTNPDSRARLSALCGNQAHIAEAPVFIAWCADLRRLDLVCRLRNYTQSTEYTESFLVAAVDTAIAAQNAILAAESLGLGACYIGAIRNDPQGVIDLLHLSPLMLPLVGMTLGWPASRPKRKPRLPTAAVLHWEVYAEDELVPLLHEYDREMVATGIYEGRQVPVPGKPEAVEDYGWLEHTARRVSQPYRQHLREALERQGFNLG